MQPPAKRRHLGRNVKAAQSSLRDSEAATSGIGHGTNTLVVESDLVYDVLKKWSWGHMQATEVQHVCMQAYNDFKRVLTSINQSTDHIPKDLQVVASLGKYGEYPGNIKRDLLSLLGTPCAPAFSFAEIPCKISKGLGEGADSNQNVSIPFNLPHIVMSYLHKNNRESFDELFFGGSLEPGKLAEFWKAVVTRKDPRIANHPMCKRNEWYNRAIPIMIHGDAVPAVGVGKAGAKSWDCYSFQSCLTRGSSKKVKVYLFGLFEDSKIKDVTIDECWRVCLASLTAAYEGKFPDGSALAGEDLCDGFSSFYGV